MKKIGSFIAAILFTSVLCSSCSDDKTIDPISNLISDDAVSNLHLKRLYDNESPYTLCYENNDGTTSLYIFTSPIAYYSEEGALVPINNSLISITDNGMREKGYVLENKDCDIKVYFPKNLLNTQFLIQNQEDTLSFSPASKLVDIDLKTGMFTDALGRKLPSVTYQKEGNVQLEYVPTSAGIMANVVISAKPESNTIDFYIKKQESLSYENKDNQYILFRDAKKNTSKAVIYTTFLQDAIGSTSFNNTVDIADENEVWKYTLVLDDEFLKNPNTQYPVTITPTFELYRNTMPDSTIYENKPSTNVFLANYAVLGNNEYYGNSLHHLRFRINYVFKSFEQNVKSASYVTTALSNDSAQMSVEMLRLRDVWSSTHINWLTRFKTYEEECETTISKAGRYSFDITNFVKACIEDEEWNTEVYGLAMSAADGVKGTKVVATSDNMFYQPYIRIDFYDLPWAFERLNAINPDQGL